MSECGTFIGRKGYRARGCPSGGRHTDLPLQRDDQSMKNFDYLEPKTVAEACALLKQHGGDAKVFAGGAHLTILDEAGAVGAQRH